MTRQLNLQVVTGHMLVINNPTAVSNNLTALFICRLVQFLWHTIFTVATGGTGCLSGGTDCLRHVEQTVSQVWLYTLVSLLGNLLFRILSVLSHMVQLTSFDFNKVYLSLIHCFFLISH